MAERRRAGRGLERPELALLLAYAKRALARDLLESGFCEDPWLERDLREYFPEPVVERFGHLLPEHPLRRELIAMINANLVVELARARRSSPSSPPSAARRPPTSCARTGSRARSPARTRAGTASSRSPGTSSHACRRS